jgi:hypothetical protein
MYSYLVQRTKLKNTNKKSDTSIAGKPQEQQIHSSVAVKGLIDMQSTVFQGII